MGFVRIFWKKNVQEAYLPKMSISGQIVSEILWSFLRITGLRSQRQFVKGLKQRWLMLTSRIYLVFLFCTGRLTPLVCDIADSCINGPHTSRYLPRSLTKQWPFLKHVDFSEITRWHYNFPMDWTPLKPSRWVLGVIQSSLRSIYQVYVLFFNFYAYFGDSSLATVRSVLFSMIYHSLSGLSYRC